MVSTGNLYAGGDDSAGWLIRSAPNPAAAAAVGVFSSLSISGSTGHRDVLAEIIG